MVVLHHISRVFALRRPWVEEGNTAYRRGAWPIMALVGAMAWCSVILMAVLTHMSISPQIVMFTMIAVLLDVFEIDFGEWGIAMNGPVYLATALLFGVPGVLFMGVCLTLGGTMFSPYLRREWSRSIMYLLYSPLFFLVLCGAITAARAVTPDQMPGIVLVSMIVLSLVSFVGESVVCGFTIHAKKMDAYSFKSYLREVVQAGQVSVPIDITMGTAIVLATQSAWWAVLLFVPPVMIVWHHGQQKQRLAAAEDGRDTAMRMAATDPLTGLLNRRGLEDALDAVSGTGAGRIVLAGDLDYFKLINDSLGHDVGDRVLERAAECFADAARMSGGTAARIGGEEFVLVIDGSIAEAEVAAEVIRLTTERRCGDWGVTISIGIAPFERGLPAECTPQMAFQQALKHADTALYNAKRAGRNRICVWTPDDLIDHGVRAA